MQQNRIEVINKSDVGSVRPHNEDSTASDPRLGFAVVADGMGGYLAGEAASAIAVTSIVHYLMHHLPHLHINGKQDPPGNNSVLLRPAIEEANHQVYTTAHNEKDCKGMGTTIVAVLFSNWQPHNMIVAHVGDSRLYRLRDNCMTQITKDHSLIQEMIDKGVCSTVEEALEFVSKTYITRALGIAKKIEVDVSTQQIKKNDIYLLCSDGLSDMLPDRQIHRILVQHAHDLEQAATELVHQANSAGGKDNISTILVRINATSDEEEDRTHPSEVDNNKRSGSAARKGED